MIGLLCAYLRRKHQTSWIALCYAEPVGYPTWIARTYEGVELARARRLRVALFYALRRPASGAAGGDTP